MLHIEYNGKTLEVIPVEYANSVLPEDWVFVGGDAGRVRPIEFKVYLIKSGERMILVDAGCETMPGFDDMKNFIGPIKALENIGVKPSDITDVVITHSHHDHIECVKYFDKAIIHIQREEYESGKDYIPESFNVNLFDDGYTVCENVNVVKIGGHSQGSCIVEMKAENGIYVITGDECYSRECLEKKIPTGNSFCPEKSKSFIEKYSDDKYIALLCHDD